MLTNMTFDAFDEFFDILSASFPKEEYRPYAAQKRLFDKAEYGILILPYADVTEDNADGKSIAAFLALWDFGTFAYLEHFAVRSELRSMGLGARLLKEAGERLKKPLVLECEPHGANEMADRRIAFYERNGFVLNEYPYIQPSMGEGRDPIPLMLMTSPSAIDEETFAFYRGTLYEKVYETLDKKERV